MVVARCRDCYGFPWIFVCFGCVSLWTCFCIFLFSFLFLLIVFAIVLLSRSCSISECRSSVYSKCVMLGASECFVCFCFLFLFFVSFLFFIFIFILSGFFVFVFLFFCCFCSALLRCCFRSSYCALLLSECRLWMCLRVPCLCTWVFCLFFFLVLFLVLFLLLLFLFFYFIFNFVFCFAFVARCCCCYFLASYCSRALACKSAVFECVRARVMLAHASVLFVFLLGFIFLFFYHFLIFFICFFVLLL